MAKKKPIILSVDDDPQVLKSIKADLRNRYRKDYRIISTDSAQEALGVLPELRNRGEEVALLLSDQRMPEMKGVDFLKQAKEVFPFAKRALLTAYSEVDAAIRAINEVQLDYYLTKPWNPPTERFYPIIDELLEEYAANREVSHQGIKLLAYQNHPVTHAIKEFLAGNLVPYRFIDPRMQPVEVESFLQINDLSEEDFPVVILEDGQVLKKTDINEVAMAIGLKAEARYDLYDVVVVGSGPAGLSAGVYGGSEGLRSAVVEKMAPGGQAGTSSRIENYLGFPNGISGAELSRRAHAQALKFGVEFISPAEVDGLSIDGIYKKLHLSSGQTLITKAVVLATGMTYRMHPAPGMDDLTGIAVYYGAATTEALSCRDKQIIIIGGGNSAGQGAVYLSNFAEKVTIMIRRPDLSQTMSQYLIDQIDAIDNIEVAGNTEITAVDGREGIESITVRDRTSGETRSGEADAIFVFIGTRPNTDWLAGQLLRDEKGFILTGNDLLQQPDFPHGLVRKERSHGIGNLCAGDFRRGGCPARGDEPRSFGGRRGKHEHQNDPCLPGRSLEKLFVQFVFDVSALARTHLQDLKDIGLDGMRNVTGGQVVAIQSEWVFYLFTQQFNTQQGKKHEHDQRYGRKVKSGDEGKRQHQTVGGNEDLEKDGVRKWNGRLLNAFTCPEYVEQGLVLSLDVDVVSLVDLTLPVPFGNALEKLAGNVVGNVSFGFVFGPVFIGEINQLVEIGTRTEVVHQGDTKV